MSGMSPVRPFCLLLAVLLPWGTCLGQTPEPGRLAQLLSYASILDAKDHNNNWSLEADEVGRILLPARKRAVLAMDQDGDGAVTRAEVRSAMQEFLAKRTEVLRDKALKKFDRDGDGTISLPEAQTNPALQKLFLGINRDGDEFFSPEELDQALSFAVSLICKKQIDRMKAGVGVPVPERPKPAQRIFWILADEDANGTIEASEFDGFLQKVVGPTTADFIQGRRTLVVPLQANAQASTPAAAGPDAPSVPDGTGGATPEDLRSAPVTAMAPTPKPSAADPVAPPPAKPGKDPAPSRVDDLAGNPNSQARSAGPKVVSSPAPAPAAAQGTPAPVRAAPPAAVAPSVPAPAVSEKRRVLISEGSGAPLSGEEEYDLVKDLITTAGSEETLW